MIKESKIDPNGLYRLRSIVRTQSGDMPLIDVCPATWWAGVKTGRYPPPLSKKDGRMTFWRGSDLLAYVESLSEGGTL